MMDVHILYLPKKNALLQTVAFRVTDNNSSREFREWMGKGSLERSADEFAEANIGSLNHIYGPNCNLYHKAYLVVKWLLKEIQYRRAPTKKGKLEAVLEDLGRVAYITKGFGTVGWWAFPEEKYMHMFNQDNRVGDMVFIGENFFSACHNAMLVENKYLGYLSESHENR